MVIKTVVTLNTRTGEKHVKQSFEDKRIDYSGVVKTIAERMVSDEELKRGQGKMRGTDGREDYYSRMGIRSTSTTE